MIYHREWPQETHLENDLVSIGRCMCSRCTFRESNAPACAGILQLRHAPEKAVLLRK